MHSRILITILLLVYGLLGQAQYSTSAKMLMLRLESLEKTALKKQIIPAAFDKRFSIVRQAEGIYVLGTIDVGPDFNASAIVELGIKINSRVSQFINVAIPLESLIPLGTVQGIRYIQISVPAKPRLDAARSDTDVDEVHLGDAPLNTKYDGAGVVVGIIDFGFDLTHPTFFDSSGNIYRIKKVWDTEDATGPPPNPFSYGTEITGDADIQAWLYTASSGSHGTHVASTAGGSGRGSDNRYVGVAPAVDLVLVDIGGGQVPDAINYIFDYAESVGKAAVINMSLGSHLGPHDGTSTMDQQIDSLSGPGRILVGAAGNEGDTPLHLGYVFTGPGDTISTIIGLESGEISGTIELWGSPNSDFSVQLALFDYLNEINLDVSGFKASSSDGYIEDSLATDTETAYFEITAQASNIYNERPTIRIWVQNETSHEIVLSFTSSSGEVHVWNNGQGNGAPLTSEEILDFSDGDTTYTVGEIGGTANEIITAGAYTTKTEMTNVGGDIVSIGFTAPFGAIAPFSSIGPTLDGRTKPDITAPGNAIVAAYNSYAQDDDSLEMALIVNDRWVYGSMQGTSMAAPFTAGVIALMLEANPFLTPDGIKEIFWETGRVDAQTGDIAEGGSNTWGSGKIAALAAVDLAANSLAVDRLAGPIPSKMMLHANYPNPFNPSTILRYDLPVAVDVSLAIYDVKGREVNRLVNGLQEPGSYRITWNGRGKFGAPMPSGIYFARITGPDYSHSIKMVLLK